MCVCVCADDYHARSIAYDSKRVTGSMSSMASRVLYDFDSFRNAHVYEIS